MASPDALLRLAYVSECKAAPAQRQAQAREIATRASTINSKLGITGLLALVSGRFLQILEGPGPAVEALFARIRTDVRHSDVTLLLCVPIAKPSFVGWAMGLVERSEPAEVTAARARVIQQRLAEDYEISATDFLRWMLAPSPNPPSEPASRRKDAITRIAFASPGGLWNASVLQHLAGDKSVRVGRSQVIDANDPQTRALLEYADLDVANLGAVRALSMSREPASCPLMGPLFEQLSLLVFLLGPSEFAQFMPYFESWMALPQIQAARPRLLLLTGLSAERTQDVMAQMQSHTDIAVVAQRLKLSDPKGVWKATCQTLPEIGLAAAPTPAGPEAAPATSKPKTTAQKASGAKQSAAVLAAAEPPEADRLRQALAACAGLEELMALEGAAEAAALCTEPTAVLLFRCNNAIHDDAQMQSHTHFLQAKLQLVRQLQPGDDVEEICLVTQHRLHLFRQVQGYPSLFLAVSLDRAQTQLGAAKLKLQEIEAGLVFG
jgi:Sensors of blue-light using FAD